MKKLAPLLIISLGLLGSNLIDLHKTEAKIVFLDVGQGDAIYIRTTTGRNILVDAGAGSWTLRELARYMPRADHTLDLVVATHLDKDHIGGLPDIFKQYDVTMVLCNGQQKETEAVNNLFAAIDEEGLEPVVANNQMSFALSELKMDVLWPPSKDSPDYELTQSNSNDAGIVLSLTFGSQNLLLTGDISTDIEQHLLELHQIGRYSALQLPHHGSKTSSGTNLLNAAKPKSVYVSVGEKNHYGHPSEEALNRAAEAQADIKRTDLDGSLIIPLN